MILQRLGLVERRCPGCGTRHPGVCAECTRELRAGPPRTLDGGPPVTSLFAYDQTSAALVLAMKNGGRRDLLARAGRMLAERLVAEPGFVRPDLVTWIPAHAHGRRRRGHDQGQILARAVARRLGAPSGRMLRRRDGASRRGVGVDERRRGPRLEPVGRRADRVLVVDDVCTTGGSARAALDALADRTRQVEIAVLAAVPDADVRQPSTFDRIPQPGRSLHGGHDQRSSHNGAGKAPAVRR